MGEERNVPRLRSQAKWEAGSHSPEVGTPTPQIWGRRPCAASPTQGSGGRMSRSHTSMRAEAPGKGAWARCCHRGQGALYGDSLAQFRDHSPCLYSGPQAARQVCASCNGVRRGQGVSSRSPASKQPEARDELPLAAGTGGALGLASSPRQALGKKSSP